MGELYIFGSTNTKVGLSTFDNVLWIASAILPVLIVFRILHQRLCRAPFDAFIALLSVVVIRDVVLALLHYGSRAYLVMWEASVPAIVIVHIGAAQRLLKSIAQLYPFTGKFACRLFGVCLLLALVGCCLGLPFEFRHFNAHEMLLRTTFLLQRLVDSAIASTLVLVALSLLWGPAPPKQPPRNIVLHTVLLTIYFGGYGSLFFIENLFKLGSAQVIERVQFSLVVFTYCIWATCLSSKGQQSEQWSGVEAVSLRRVSFTPTPTPAVD